PAAQSRSTPKPCTTPPLLPTVWIGDPPPPEQGENRPRIPRQDAIDNHPEENSNETSAQDCPGPDRDRAHGRLQRRGHGPFQLRRAGRLGEWYVLRLVHVCSHL